MARRLSLHVGINDFPGTGMDLWGCVNDAKDWQAYAGSQNYETEILLDTEATRARILERLSALLAGIGPGGRGVFTVSSHGTQVPVVGTDSGEPDAMNEAFCSHDFRTGGLITDDDLYRVLRRRPQGSRVFLAIDTCHAGTMHRSALDLPFPREEQAARYLPPVVVGEEGLRVAAEREAEVVETGPVSPVPMLAACAPREVSWDTSFGGRPNGAFSYYALRAAAEEPGTLWSWMRKIRDSLPSDRLPQTPQLDATLWQKTWTPLK